ncbi:ComF family protein [Candidatus Peregrinibacteria bacterium]|nr:ComF family protein [Candidatus Peregrinibacteria bacterium]
MNFMKLKDLVLNVLFPKICFGCGNGDCYLCEKCFRKFSLVDHQICPVCDRINDGEILCSRNGCRKMFCFDKLIVCLNYEKESLLSKLIVNFKYNFIEELHFCLGEILITQMNSQFGHYEGEKTLITFVPLHKKKFKERGFNQSELLAKYAAEKTGLKIFDCLDRPEFRRDQVSLSQKERLINLVDSIKVKKDFEELIQYKNIILIDDVATTCSTLNECSKALKKSGANKVYCIVLARGSFSDSIKEI